MGGQSRKGVVKGTTFVRFSDLDWFFSSIDPIWALFHNQTYFRIKIQICLDIQTVNSAYYSIRIHGKNFCSC